MRFSSAPARFLPQVMSAGTIIDGALSAESWIRQAVVEGGFTPGLVGLANAKAEDAAASRWADCARLWGLNGSTPGLRTHREESLA